MSRETSWRRGALLSGLAAVAVLTVGSAQAGGPNSGANSALIQPDGRIVAAGWGETASWGAAGVFGLVRYTPAGSLDRSFGSGGKVTTPPGSWPGARAVALQSDGTIVVAGTSTRGFGLARYTAAGSLDKTFGTGGKVATAFSSLATQAAALAIQADGKIVAAGPFQNGDRAGFALARYSEDGSRDPTFGVLGRVTTTVGGGGELAVATQPVAVAIQPDGKIVVVGQSCGGPCVFALARYNADGSLDPSFGNGGVVKTAVSPYGAGATAVALQLDGKIVTAGWAAFVGTSRGSSFALARYLPDGSLDPSFGSGGIAKTAFIDVSTCDECGDTASAVALQPDGKIVAAGQTCQGPCAFALARYDPDGSPDTGFGSSGMVTTSFGLPVPQTENGGDYADAVAIQPDDKIVAAGYSNFGSSGPDYFKFALARYKPDGSLDAGFGKTGRVSTAVAACLVPKLLGEGLSWAKQAVTGSHCAIGKVSSVYSRTIPKGHVVSQRPTACVLRAPRWKVRLTLSKGSSRPRTSAIPYPGAIAYDSRTHLSCGEGGTGPPHLFAVQPNGSGRQQLPLRGNATDPAWSPNGRDIAFARPAGGVLVMRARTGKARVVVAQDGSEPSFSPNGKRIAFETADHTIWSVRTNGTGRRKIVTGGHPDWSPDGKQIAFVGRDLDLYTVSANGGHREAVTQGGNSFLPVWSPNGEQIAFVLAGETSWELAVINLSDHSSRVLAPHVIENTKPAWSPDGKQIAFARYSSAGDQLATIRAAGGGLRIVTGMIGGATAVSWRR